MRQGMLSAEHEGYRFLFDFDRREMMAYELNLWGNHQLVYHCPFHSVFDPLEWRQGNSERFLKAFKAASESVDKLLETKGGV